MKYILLLGRILFSAIFLMTVTHHFSAQAVSYAAMQGVPWPSVLVPLSGVIAIAGAISIMLGYKAKIGAWLIVIFLVPVTLFMHRFWSETDPMTMQMQMGMFMKNLSMLGGAFILTWFGAGPLSMDTKAGGDKSVESET